MDHIFHVGVYEIQVVGNTILVFFYIHDQAVGAVL